MTTRRVLIVGTGGTIASEPTPDGLSPVSHLVSLPTVFSSQYLCGSSLLLRGCRLLPLSPLRLLLPHPLTPPSSAPTPSSAGSANTPNSPIPSRSPHPLPTPHHPPKPIWLPSRPPSRPPKSARIYVTPNSGHRRSTIRGIE